MKDSWLDLLVSHRLRLVPFRLDHIQQKYINWLNNPLIVRYSNQRFHQHTYETCRRYFESFANTSNHFLAIEDKSNQQLIGTLTVYTNSQHKTADVGILVGESGQWGKGFGHEAFDLVVESLLTVGNVRKVTAGTMALNVGMIKVMEKCGMHLEATRIAQELLDGHAMDIVYYAKFNSHQQIT